MLCMLEVEVLRGWRRCNNTSCGGAGTVGEDSTMEAGMEALRVALLNGAERTVMYQREMHRNT